MAHIFSSARLFGAALALSVLLLPNNAPADARGFPARSKYFKNMCAWVGEHATDPRRKVRYKYQVEILTAAGALEDTDPKVIRRKVSQSWDWSDPSLYCTNIQFDLSRGSILKYAVSSTFDHFIDDVIKWGVDLNHVDNPSDHRVGGTVLDYVALHRNLNAGTAMASKFEFYYRKFREGGALHMHELAGGPRDRELRSDQALLKDVFTGRPIDSSVTSGVLSMAKRQAQFADARLEGNGRVTAYSGATPCVGQFSVDNSDVALLIKGQRHSLKGIKPFGAGELTVSWGWDVEAANNNGSDVIIRLSNKEEPITVAVADANIAGRAAGAIDRLRKICNPYG